MMGLASGVEASSYGSIVWICSFLPISQCREVDYELAFAVKPDDFVQVLSLLLPSWLRAALVSSRTLSVAVGFGES